DHAARLRVLVEHDAVIAERGEIPRDRERGGAAAHERNALTVLDRRRLGQALADIVLEVGGDPFEPTDRDRLVLHAHAPARTLGRAHLRTMREQTSAGLSPWFGLWSTDSGRG